MKSVAETITPVGATAPRTRPFEPSGRVLVNSYQPKAGSFDESMAVPGQIRPYWHDLMEAFAGFAPGEFAANTERARQLLHENGVTYNVYGDPRNATRAVELDLVPLVIAEEEWAALETGLIQRARLMNALLADVYGRQRLIADGVLHPALVQTNPDYLAPVRGLQPPGDLWLHVYAVDLMRGPDGQWRAAGDRTRTPAGAGYALENRIVTSRALAEIYRGLNVRRLAAWFDTLRQSLRTLAPWTRNPRVVVLTPGPFNETYFEHAYLARYLGYTLVEGNDITVRDDRVFLKTLGGLEPVDVILRRVDDDFCDPLELRGDSTLGTAGLLQAARNGRVVIANALGSGFAETPALTPFLPALCDRLLGEPLHLPTLDTRWSGTAETADQFLKSAAIETLSPAFPKNGDAPPADRAAWTRHLKRNPYDAVAQARLRLSTMPSFGPNGFEAAPVVLRVFLAASDHGYTVMPGALVRVSPDPERPRIRLQQGGVAKDAWVLSRTPVDDFSLLRAQDTQVEVRRQGNNLPSRVADDLYWVGRYAERAEFGIRALRALVLRLTDGGGPGASAEIAPGARFLAEIGELPFDLATLATSDRAAFTRRLVPTLFDEGRMTGFNLTLWRLNANAGMVRDRLSIDMSRVLQGLHNLLDAMRRTPSGDFVGLLGRFDTAVGTMAAVSGLGMENMTRGQAWRFMDLGRRLERAMGCLLLVRHLIMGGPDGAGRALDLALETADSFMTYRARYFTSAQLAPVIDLLMLDEANPRSLAFQVASLADHIENLPRERGANGSGTARLLVQTLLAELRGAEVKRLAGTDTAGRHRELAALIDAVFETLPELSDIISQTYFSHALAVRPVGPIRIASRS